MGRLRRAAESSGSRPTAAWRPALLWGLAGLLVVLLALATRGWFASADPVRTDALITGYSAGGQPSGPVRQTPTVTVSTTSTLVEPAERPTPSSSVPTQPSVTLPDVSSETVDVVIYGTQTSGLTAARELTREDPGMRVAIISSGEYLQSPLAQGLSVEDARHVDRVVGGVYEEWRNDVIRHYDELGLKAFTKWGRFVYEPDVAERYLWRLLERSEGEPILFYAGRLVDAQDGEDGRFVTVQSTEGELVRINTSYFIDASVEADLARQLGADYRIGRDETIYNDGKGPLPPYPSEDNGFVTAPQRLSALLTLVVDDDGSAPFLPRSWVRDPPPVVPLSATAVNSFGHCWSMNIAQLPNGMRELNETWSDYPDMSAAFEWVFDSAKRPVILQQAAERALGQVSFLRQNGYPNVGVTNVPEYPYVREGPRVVGLSTYTVADILSEAKHDVVATGCYAQYDRHDYHAPNQLDATAFVRVPMTALMVAGHPRLVVSTAVSTDFRAYSSAVRTELARANMGGAAGIMVLLAARAGLELDRLAYDEVRELLDERGYRLP